jgi:uncharacterized protein (TIGR00369 family)
VQPKDPAFEQRVRAAFERQRFMQLVGATMTAVGPGTVELAMPITPELTQQHGLVHGGVVSALLDTACGFAASSLMPADAGVLTIEFKVNFLAASRGTLLRARADVRRAGRTVTFVEGEAIAEADGGQRTVATIQATMMCVVGRDDIRH